MNRNRTRSLRRAFVAVSLVALAGLGTVACSDSDNGDEAGTEAPSEDTAPIETDPTHLTCTVLGADPDAASPAGAFVQRVVDASQGLSATQLDENLELISGSVPDELEAQFDVMYGAIRSSVIDGVPDALTTPDVEAAIADADAWAATECPPTSNGDAGELDD